MRVFANARLIRSRTSSSFTSRPVPRPRK
jgi:hypothetical protein